MFNQILSSLLGNHQSVSLTELAERLEKGEDILLDVRSPEEFASGHIPQAINVPLDEVADYKGDKSKGHLIICASGARSLQATTILKRQGYTATNVSSGMNAWTGHINKGEN